MKTFIIERSDDEFYSSTSGISLVGLSLNRYTTLASTLAREVPLSHGIPHADAIRSYCALLAQGKSDYAAIEQHRDTKPFVWTATADSILEKIKRLFNIFPGHDTRRNLCHMNI